MKRLMIVFSGLILLATVAIGGCMATEEKPVEMEGPDPTEQPSPEPTQDPDADPTEQPTPEQPTRDPDADPTEQPTPEQPTQDPDADPTEQPTPDPTEQPTPEPTEQPLQPQEMKVNGMIQVGVMSFNDLYVYAVKGVPGATNFSVVDVGTLRAIDGDEPVTFMKDGSTTVQITNAAGTVIATGTLPIPGDLGKHPFEIAVTSV